MGEIDTKPIESVQTALSFFGQRTDFKRTPSDEELEKKREVERLTKELANVRVQVEAKDSAYKQTLLKLDHYQKTADELTILLKKSDYQKEFYINECQESKHRIDELESAAKHTADCLLESEKERERLSHVASDLDSAQKTISEIEMEVESLRRSKSESVSQVRELERALTEEKLINEKLSERVSEMNDFVEDLKIKIAEAEREKDGALAARDRLELVEKKNVDQADYINQLEKELEQLRNELGNAKSEMGRLNGESENLKSEMERIKEMENDAQVEIAMLKFDLHKTRSKLAAAEARQLAGNNEICSDQAPDEERERSEIIPDGKEQVQVPNDVDEVEKLKNELEAANVKIVELRTRAEQAISRAEAAEKGKAAVEEEMRRRKEHRLRKKAAMDALRVFSGEHIAAAATTNGSCSGCNDDQPQPSPRKYHQPLAKVLNMKF